MRCPELSAETVREATSSEISDWELALCGVLVLIKVDKKRRQTLCGKLTLVSTCAGGIAVHRHLNIQRQGLRAACVLVGSRPGAVWSHRVAFNKCV